MEKTNSKSVISVALLCLTAAIAGIAGCDIQFSSSFRPQVESKRTEQLSAPLAGGSMVEIETSRGSITITGADVQACSITATIKAWAENDEEAKELAEKTKIELKGSDKKLAIITVRPKLENNQSIGVDFDLIVPRKTHIQCASSRGSIKVTNIQGDLKGAVSRGSITAEAIQGSAELTTSRGNIACKDISNGDIKLRTSRGHINLDNASAGSLLLASSRGHIDVCKTSATTARISSSRGHITCKDITFAELTGEISRGNFKIDYSQSSPPEIAANITTSRGNINLVPPPAFAGQINLDVSRGSINTNLPIKVKGEISKEKITGTVGQGNGKLSLKTSRGSITIK